MGELQQELRITQVELDLGRKFNEERSRIFLKTCSISSLEKARAGTFFSRFADCSKADKVCSPNPAEEIRAGPRP
jgi:hypothetical protein